MAGVTEHAASDAAIISANIGLPGEAVRGQWWFRTHRPALLKQFVGMLSHSEAVMGICVSEVGNLDDLLNAGDIHRFEDLIHEAFRSVPGATEHGLPQIFWPKLMGETLSVWKAGVRVEQMQPLNKLQGLAKFRVAERFRLTDASERNPVSIIVYHTHQPASKKRPFRMHHRVNFCRQVIQDAIRMHTVDDNNVGFLCLGDPNCNRGHWLTAYNQCRLWRLHFATPQLIFADAEKAANPKLAKPGDCAVCHGIEGLEGLQEDCNVKNKDLGHDCVAVRWRCVDIRLERARAPLPACGRKEEHEKNNSNEQAQLDLQARLWQEETRRVREAAKREYALESEAEAEEAVVKRQRAACEEEAKRQALEEAKRREQEATAAATAEIRRLRSEAEAWAAAEAAASSQRLACEEEANRQASKRREQEATAAATAEIRRQQTETDWRAEEDEIDFGTDEDPDESSDDEHAQDEEFWQMAKQLAIAVVSSVGGHRLPDLIDPRRLARLCSRLSERDQSVFLGAVNLFFHEIPRGGVSEHPRPAIRLKSAEAILEAWRCLFERRRQMEQNDNKALEDSDARAEIWTRWCNEWLAENLTAQQQRYRWSQKTSIFGAYMRRTYGSKKFFFALLETGITWAAPKDLLSSDPDSAAEHVVGHFVKWVQRVTNSIDQHAAADTTVQARVRSGSGPGQHGLDPRQVENRNARDNARRDYYQTLHLEAQLRASKGKGKGKSKRQGKGGAAEHSRGEEGDAEHSRGQAVTPKRWENLTYNEKWWLDELWSRKLLEKMRVAESRCDGKIEAARFSLSPETFLDGPGLHAK